MDILLLILGMGCLLVGTAGAVLPLPGPPLSFGGLILLQLSKYAHFSQELLIGLGIATALIVAIDYYIPIWGTKKMGGSKYGMWGSTAGMLLGLFFFPPLGLFIGAFVGALVGEKLGGASNHHSFRAAMGTFLGFAAGIAMKLTLCFVMLFYAGQALWQYWK